MPAAADHLGRHSVPWSQGELAIHQTAAAAASMSAEDGGGEDCCSRAGAGCAGMMPMVAGPQAASVMFVSRYQKEYCWWLLLVELLGCVPV